MKTLFILNDAPYGSERTYNGLRLAGAVAKQADSAVRVFLIGDGASASHRNQKVPQGFYNVEVMIGNVIRSGGEIGVCGTCMDARGIGEAELVEGAHRGSMAELTEWVLWADKVIAF